MSIEDYLIINTLFPMALSFVVGVVFGVFYRTKPKTENVREISEEMRRQNIPDNPGLTDFAKRVKRILETTSKES